MARFHLASRDPLLATDGAPAAPVVAIRHRRAIGSGARGPVGRQNSIKLDKFGEIM